MAVAQVWWSRLLCSIVVVKTTICLPFILVLVSFHDDVFSLFLFFSYTCLVLVVVPFCISQILRYEMLSVSVSSYLQVVLLVVCFVVSCRVLLGGVDYCCACYCCHYQ